MYRKLSKYREFLLAIMDTLLVVLAYVLAYFLRTDFGRTAFAVTDRSLMQNMIFVVIINLSSILIFHLNRSLWMYVSIDEAYRVGKAVFVGNFIWWIFVMLGWVDRKSVV